MKIFITKQGRQLGPYTIEQIHSQVQAGTLEATDWAWYEGMADWKPLNHIPGFTSYQLPTSSTRSTPPPTPFRRPGLVWVISLFYFVSIPLGLLSIAVTFSRVLPMGETQRNYLESFNSISFAFIGLLYLLDLAGAIFLFLMRRPALYFFGGAFLLSVANSLYQAFFTSWLSVIETSNLTLITAIVGLAFAYLIKIAVIGYVGYLYFAKDLR